MKSFQTTVAVGCSLALMIGCSKKEPENQQTFYPQQNDQYQQQQPAPQPAPAPAPAQPAAAVTAMDPAVQQVMAAALMQPAQTQAKGMTKSGETMGANLQEGQSLEQVVTLQAGKCYTVVGMGMPMVQDISIVMAPVIPIPGAPTIPLSQSVTSGSQVSMAPMPNCYTSFLPVQAKIIVTARSGSGMVGAQLYVK